MGGAVADDDLADGDFADREAELGWPLGVTGAVELWADATGPFVSAALSRKPARTKSATLRSNPPPTTWRRRL